MGFMFMDKVAVITGGAKGIGRCIAEMFRAEGAKVCIIDILPQQHDNVDLYYQGDIADESMLRSFVDEVISRYGHIDYLVNNALPLFKGIDDCTYDEFNYALRVGVSAPFMLTKLFKDHFSRRRDRKYIIIQR